MPNYAPRIGLSYDDLSGVIEIWSQTAQQVVCYEHAADSKVKKTHVHLLIMGSSVKDEALRRKFHKLIPGHKGGNELWSWSHKATSSPDLSFITYMSKGHLRPKFVQGISPDQVEEYRLKWVEPTSDNSSQVSSKYDEYHEILSDLKSNYQSGPITLDKVRSDVMRWYWQRDGRLPHAGQYKRNAASAYLHFVERREAEAPNEASFSCALEQLKNLWY